MIVPEADMIGAYHLHQIIDVPDLVFCRAVVISKEDTNPIYPNDTAGVGTSLDLIIKNIPRMIIQRFRI